MAPQQQPHKSEKGALKFVRGPDGRLYLDIAQKLKTEGMFISPERQVVDDALKNGTLAQALGAEAVQDVAAFKVEIEEQLLKRFFERLGVGRKAGQVLLGVSKTFEALQQGRAVGVFVATDAGNDTRKRLEGKTNHGDVCFESIAKKHQWEHFLNKENATVVAILSPEVCQDLRYFHQAVQAFGA